jgi:integrase
LLRKSPAHIRNASCIAKHLGALAKVYLTDLTTTAVEDALNNFLKNHTVSYGNKWLTYIRLVCKWAVRRGKVRAVFFDVPKTRIKQKPKILIPTAKARQWMEEVEFLTIKEPAIAMVLRLQIGMGLRGSEARGARWEWLDFERARYTPGGTKGGAAWPRPVPPWILDILRPLAQPFGWMVPSQKGRPLTAGRVMRVFRAACKAVGLPPEIVPHRLRATYATWLSEEGVSIQSIQAALEHKDIRTTALYLGADLDSVAAAQKSSARKTGLGR